MTCNEELASARYEERPAGRNEEPTTPVMKTAALPQNTKKLALLAQDELF
ncbi:MAG: hypothetical protein IJN29_02725 [Akkermansia sp.]|nr:hypothetical protein [Akkermansia sp.]